MPSFLRRIRSVVIAVTACVLSASGLAGVGLAADTFPQYVQVKCGTRDCGLMVISRYQRFRDGDALPRYERNGARIRGWFRSAIGPAVEFHYLQVLTEFQADDFRWLRDPSVPLPVQYVDPPPFGARQMESNAKGEFQETDHTFDALPWFDEGDFPAFVDQPRAFLATARRYGKVSMKFETWLVCVIDAHAGADENSVSDDSYEVAGLAGWKWGYDIAHEDIGRVGEDELEDYSYSLAPFEFVATPSEKFKTGLGATVGSKVTDRFNVRFGDSERCLNRDR